MFENLYTTKMSAGKKTLQLRFIKIRSEAGRLSQIAAVIMLAAVIAVMFGAAIVTAALDIPAENTVAVFYGGKQQNLQNQPFTSNGEVYLPLRELMNICGVADEDISYNNGNIEIFFKTSDVTQFKAYLIINSNNIAFDKDSEYRIMGIDGERTTTHPALLVNGAAYIPSGMIMRIKNYYIAKDFDDRIYLNPLGSLEIRRYDADGKYDAVICAPIDVNGTDKYNPKSYYNENERVVIGTAEEFDKKEFGHTEINGYYFPTDAKKHIIVDENGKVVTVAPYENFRHESVDPAAIGTSSWQSAINYFGNEHKRGGVDVFSNELRVLPDGKTSNFCLLYCFVDFRYFVE